ncbi:FHA domain-containing protein [Nocardia sp. NPDC060249]|uniref:FHA domain-containing protein n=1 Tax=Nocardia sp. NPDC060249 TaxID=3347082 RepID=UPI003662D281
MADVSTDPVRCRCGKTWNRMALAQCPDDGTDLWEITTIAPPPPPPPPPPGDTPRTQLDPVTESGAAIELIAGGTIFRLESGKPLALGRDESYPTADAFRDHTNVSRFHGTLLYRDGRLLITDTASANGTFINDHRIPDDTEYEIKPGQRLRLAADVHLTIRWDR